MTTSNNPKDLGTQEYRSYTASCYEEDCLVVYDAETFESKEEAVNFAKFRHWDEVVDDKGKIVWRR